ncbi:Probable ATP-dependent RNA helicase Dbp73D [Sergentomyia squamirostris]
MGLFDVKRYAPEQKTSDPGRENKLLEKLQDVIAKKKKILEENKAKEKKKKKVEKEESAVKGEEDVSTVEDTVNPSGERGDTFPVLGDEQFSERSKVKRTLPSWLSHPVVISNDLSKNTEKVDEIDFVGAEMKENLKKMSIESLFPVQKEVIPWILDGHRRPPPYRPRDVCVSAPTGSGKTIAFALPIVELLRNRVVQKIRALVVLPVRELAEQVFNVFKNLTRGTSLDSLLFSPNKSFAAEQKCLVREVNGKQYSRVDIIVTTPGRLVEHLTNTPGFSLRDLQFLVIDEADRIMDQIQNDWLSHLENHLQRDSQFSGRNIPFSLMTLSGELSRQPHKLLFSATLSSDPEKLENMKLFQPKLFTSVVTEFKYDNTASGEKNLTSQTELVGKFTTPCELTEKICRTEVENKPLTLYKLIKENCWRRFLCFTNNNIQAHRLAFVLQKMLGENLVIEELSASLKKNVRKSIVAKFSSGKVHGLVTSDTLARGIDVANIDVVICYDCPRHVRTYIHRIGRTARAGRLGTAVTLITDEDRDHFNKILSTAGKTSLDTMPISTETDPGTTEKYTTSLAELKKFLKQEKKKKIFQTQTDENTTTKGKTTKKSKKKVEKVDPEHSGLKRKRKEVDGKEIKVKKAKKN